MTNPLALPYVPIIRHFREVTEDPKDGWTRRILRGLAAASILTKQPHITLPTSAPLPGAMDGRKLFADWEGRQLRELFTNGLFVHKGDATWIVRLIESFPAHAPSVRRARSRK